MEWLTTGQMIDRLKVGEVAESKDGYYAVRRTENRGIVFNDNVPLVVNIIALEMRWRILPKYVSFICAMKAVKDGYTVRCYPDNDASYIEFNEADSMHSVASQWGVLSWGQLTTAKWTIEED